MQNLIDLPADLRRMMETLPDADAVRERLARHRAEGALLRRLLRLALDAERAGKPSGEKEEARS